MLESKATLEPGVTLDAPGIYLWEIEGIGVYVGKAKLLQKRLRAYPNNVRKLLSELPYRKGKPDGFRNVHRALAQAVRDGSVIRCRAVENCTLEDLNAREVWWIKAHGTLNGPIR